MIKWPYEPRRASSSPSTLLHEQTVEPWFLLHMKGQFQRHLNIEPKMLLLADVGPHYNSWKCATAVIKTHSASGCSRALRAPGGGDLDVYLSNVRSVAVPPLLAAASGQPPRTTLQKTAPTSLAVYALWLLSGANWTSSLTNYKAVEKCFYRIIIAFF